MRVTKTSGDQGVDILAEKDGVRYAIQCKYYQQPLENTPVQEITAGREFYDCDIGVVMTNSTFTPGARALVKKNKIRLWDKTTIEEMIEKTRAKS